MDLGHALSYTAELSLLKKCDSGATELKTRFFFHLISPFLSPSESLFERVHYTPQESSKDATSNHVRHG